MQLLTKDSIIVASVTAIVSVSRIELPGINSFLETFNLVCYRKQREYRALGHVEQYDCESEVVQFNSFCQLLTV